MMRRLFFLALSSLFFLSLCGTVTGASVTIFTDKAEWESAVSGQFLTEDFYDILLNDGISFISSESGHINVAFGYYQDVLNASSANEPFTTWMFIPEIIAYGGTWTLGGPGGSGNYLMIFIDDMEEPVGIITNGYNNEFYGFISDTPFSSVTLVGGNWDNQQCYKLDDMVYSPVE